MRNPNPSLEEFEQDPIDDTPPHAPPLLPPPSKQEGISPTLKCIRSALAIGNQQAVVHNHDQELNDDEFFFVESDEENAEDKGIFPFKQQD